MLNKWFCLEQSCRLFCCFCRHIWFWRFIFSLNLPKVFLPWLYLSICCIIIFLVLTEVLGTVNHLIPYECHSFLIPYLSHPLLILLVLSLPFLISFLDFQEVSLPHVGSHPYALPSLTCHGFLLLTFFSVRSCLFIYFITVLIYIKFNLHLWVPQVLNLEVPCCLHAWYIIISNNSNFYLLSTYIIPATMLNILVHLRSVYCLVCPISINSGKKPK